MGNSQSGHKRRGNLSTSIEGARRLVVSQEEEIEARLRQEMELKYNQKIDQIETERQYKSDTRYDDLLGKFNDLMSKFNRLQEEPPLRSSKENSRSRQMIRTDSH
jgi:hypothetical protein